jgi:hypothetical protein
MALKVTGILGLDGTGFFQTLNRADASVRRFSSGVTSALTGRFAQLFSVGAVGYAIKRTIDYAGKLTDLSARTGVAVESLQRFDRAARDNGSSLDKMVTFWERLARARELALKDPKGMQAAAFASLGVSGGDLGKLSNEELTKQIAMKFKGQTDIQALVAPLQEVGGRGAMELAAAFQAGLDEQYGDLDVMSAEQADILDEVGDKFDSLMQELTVKLAPAIITAIDAFKKLWDNFVIGGAIVQGFGVALLDGLKGLWDAIKSGNVWTLGGAAAVFKNAFESAAKEQWKNIDDVTIGVQAEREERDKAEADARARRIAARERKPGAFSASEPDPQQYSIKPASGDSLIRVGNFLGTSTNILEAIANRQVQLLVSIEKNTRKAADKTESDLGIVD